MPGGFKAEGQPGPEEQAVLDSVKAEVETLLSKQFAEFTAVSFTTQVVAGTNYLFKVHGGDGVYLHVKVHQPLPHTGKPCEVIKATAGLSLNDPLDP